MDALPELQDTPPPLRVARWSGEAGVSDRDKCAPACFCIQPHVSRLHQRLIDIAGSPVIPLPALRRSCYSLRPARRGASSHMLLFQSGPEGRVDGVPERPAARCERRNKGCSGSVSTLFHMTAANEDLPSHGDTAALRRLQVSGKNTLFIMKVYVFKQTLDRCRSNLSLFPANSFCSKKPKLFQRIEWPKTTWKEHLQSIPNLL